MVFLSTAIPYIGLPGASSLRPSGKSVSDEGLSFILAGRRREEILRHFLGDLPESKIAEYGRQKDSFFEENFHDVKLIPGVRKFLESLETAGLKCCDRDLCQFGADVGNSASPGVGQEVLDNRDWR